MFAGGRRLGRAVSGGLALLLAASACGDDDEAPLAAEPRERAGDEVSPWADRLATGAAAELLAALGQSHATARATFGPHHLHTRTVFDLAPAPGTEPAIPALDDPVVSAQHVEDELDLRWAAAPGEPPSFALSQANDHDRGREVVLTGDRVYFKKSHRPWLFYPVESDLWDRWLDDGFHAVHDAVELAAPQLVVSAAAKSGEGLAGGDAIEISLSRTDTVDAALVPKGPTKTWRSDAQIDAVEGKILLDAASGLWLSADIAVEYVLEGADGRPLAGRLELGATIDAGPDAHVGTVEPPADASPLPERTRDRALAERLLDGLAAP